MLAHAQSALLWLLHGSNKRRLSDTSDDDPLPRVVPVAHKRARLDASTKSRILQALDNMPAVLARPIEPSKSSVEGVQPSYAVPKPAEIPWDQLRAVRAESVAARHQEEAISYRSEAEHAKARAHAAELAQLAAEREAAASRHQLELERIRDQEAAKSRKEEGAAVADQRAVHASVVSALQRRLAQHEESLRAQLQEQHQKNTQQLAVLRQETLDTAELKAKVAVQSELIERTQQQIQLLTQQLADRPQSVQPDPPQRRAPLVRVPSSTNMDTDTPDDLPPAVPPTLDAGTFGTTQAAPRAPDFGPFGAAATEPTLTQAPKELPKKPVVFSAAPANDPTGMTALPPTPPLSGFGAHPVASAPAPSFSGFGTPPATNPAPAPAPAPSFSGFGTPPATNPAPAPAAFTGFGTRPAAPTSTAEPTSTLAAGFGTAPAFSAFGTQSGFGTQLAQSQPTVHTVSTPSSTAPSVFGMVSGGFAVGTGGSGGRKVRKAKRSR